MVARLLKRDHDQPVARATELIALILRRPRRVQSTQQAIRRVRFTLALVGLAAIEWAVGKLRLNLTRSLPIGVYRVVDRESLQRGTIVLVCLPNDVGRFALAREYLWRGSCPGAAAPIGKLVLAVGGELVTFTQNGFVIDGKVQPHTRPIRFDSRGRPMVHYPFGTYVVPASDVWLYSPYHPLSFDSRYFGPVPAVNIRARVIPVLTF